MTMKVYAKRGRKSKTLFGYENVRVDTWFFTEDGWCYIGKSAKKVAGVETDGEYAYYIDYFSKKRMRQALTA